jgi:hypothetical protein
MACRLFSALMIYKYQTSKNLGAGQAEQTRSGAGSAAAFGATFGLIAWSFTTLPVAAKYRMASVRSFLLLESAFTAVQFAIVSPLLALAYRTG